MNPSIRVAMISHNYFPYVGGAERIMAEVNPRLQARGIDVRALTRYSPGLPSFARVNDVPVYRLPAPGLKGVASLIFTLRAVQLLSRLGPDIIHAHIMFSPANIAVIAKYLFGVPVVVTLHGGGLAPSGEIARLQQTLLGRWRLAVFRRQIDCFLPVSREIAQELEGIGIPPERRRLIPNGIDSTRYAPLLPDERRALRQTMKIPDVPVVVFTGRLIPTKCVHHLLTIWPDVRREYPEAILLVVGAGPEQQRLQQEAGDGVRFTGEVNDVRPYLQIADLFVLPSVAEGLSLSLLEAMATGLPVITTKLAGAIDLITHGENGWLVPPDDVPALQDAVLTLLGNPEIRAGIGTKGRIHVSRNYSLATMVESLINLYKQLLMRRL